MNLFFCEMPPINKTTQTLVVINFIGSLLEEDPHDRLTISEAFSHPWLAPYRPHWGCTREKQEEDTEEGTAQEDKGTARTKLTTRAMARAQRQKMSRKVVSRRKSKVVPPQRTESGSGTSFDADMFPVTPLRSKRNEPITPQRRSQRSRTTRKV